MQDQPTHFYILHKIVDIALGCLELETKVGENLQRKIKVFLVMKFCRKATTLMDITDWFELSVSDLNMLVHRFKLQLKKDRKLQELVTKIEEKCKNV